MSSSNSYVPGGLLRALGTGSDSTIDRHYHLDALGSVQAITGSSQSVETSYRTDAWGNVLAGSATDNPAVYLGGLGYWNEPSLGLDYVRARWLNPVTGSWLSVDPVTTEPRYRYAASAPTFRVDPSGTQYGDNPSVGSKTFYGPPPSAYSPRRMRVIEQADRDNAKYGTGAQLFGAVGALWESDVTALLHLPEPWWRWLVESMSQDVAAFEGFLGILPVMKGLDKKFIAILPALGPFAAIAPPVLGETPFSPDYPAYVGGALYGLFETAGHMVLGVPGDIFKIIGAIFKIPRALQELVRLVGTLWRNLFSGKLLHDLVAGTRNAIGGIPQAGSAFVQALERIQALPAYDRGKIWVRCWQQ